MLSRIDLQEISESRLEEAKILFGNNKFDGAKYILGYTLETALKARICKILDSDYPERAEVKNVFFSHKFDILIFLGGLEKLLNNQNLDPNFALNWSLVTDSSSTFAWKETLRYEKIGTANKAELENIFKAMEDPNYGILTWIKTVW